MCSNYLLFWWKSHRKGSSFDSFLGWQKFALYKYQQWATSPAGIPWYLDGDSLSFVFRNRPNSYWRYQKLASPISHQEFLLVNIALKDARPPVGTNALQNIRVLWSTNLSCTVGTDVPGHSQNRNQFVSLWRLLQMQTVWVITVLDLTPNSALTENSADRGVVCQMGCYPPFISGGCIDSGFWCTLYQQT